MPQNETTERTTGWWLDADDLSELAKETLRRTIDQARQSHVADALLRHNGQEVRIQADWIKYLMECKSDER